MCPLYRKGRKGCGRASAVTTTRTTRPTATTTLRSTGRAAWLSWTICTTHRWVLLYCTVLYCTVLYSVLQVIPYLEPGYMLASIGVAVDQLLCAATAIAIVYIQRNKGEVVRVIS